MCFSPEAIPPELPEETPRQQATGERIVLSSSDGATFAAYTASPEAPDDTGVVIFPDVRGLFGFYDRLAERFATAGHRAIAFDYFGRTAGTELRDADFEFMPHVEQIESSQVAADAASAADRLRQQGATRVFTVGFCLGGALSFGQAVDDRYAGVVGFYGVMRTDRFQGVTSPLDTVERSQVPVLGLFGGADPAVPADDVAAFEQGLDRAGVPYETHTYPGAPHSFFDRTHGDHVAECTDGWRRMLAFMEREPATV
ncbi:MAG: dienelactone hydrolase family protein [Streptosporangiales bacterium]